MQGQNGHRERDFSPNTARLTPRSAGDRVAVREKGWFEIPIRQLSTMLANEQSIRGERTTISDLIGRASTVYQRRKRQ
jgi:hypothetical protein